MGRAISTIVIGCFHGRAAHNTDDTFHDIVDIGEIAHEVAIVKDLYCFSCGELFRGAVIEHVRSSCRAVDGEEAQTRAGNVV